MKKLIVLLVIVIASASTGAANLYAQQPLEKRCETAQQYLKNVRRSNDLRARVDRLQAYQYINQRMDVFVTRLEKNSQPKAKELRSELSSLEEYTESFKRHYESYDEARDAAANLKDCTKKVPEFQKLLLSARDKRAAVYKDVMQIQNTHSGLVQQLTELKVELSEDE